MNAFVCRVYSIPDAVTTAEPLEGLERICTELVSKFPSTSLSLASTSTVTNKTSFVRKKSSTATGGSSTELIVTVTVPVAMPMNPSSTIYVNSLTPLKSWFGVYVML